MCQEFCIALLSGTYILRYYNGTVIAALNIPHEIPYIPPDTGIVTRSGEEFLTMCLKLSQKRIVRLVRIIGTLGHPRSAVNEFRLECEQWWAAATGKSR